MSIACMIPFDMSRLDGTFGVEKGEKREPIVDRIMDAAKVTTLSDISLYLIDLIFLSSDKGAPQQLRLIN